MNISLDLIVMLAIFVSTIILCLIQKPYLSIVFLATLYLSKAFLYRLLYYTDLSALCNQDLQDIFWKFPGFLLSISGVFILVRRFLLRHFSAMDKCIFIYIIIILLYSLFPGVSFAQRAEALYRQVFCGVAFVFVGATINKTNHHTDQIILVFLTYGLMATLYGYFQYFFGFPMFEKMWLINELADKYTNWRIDPDQTMGIWWLSPNSVRLMSFSSNEMDFTFPLIAVWLFCLFNSSSRAFSGRFTKILFIAFLVLFPTLLLLSLKRSAFAMIVVGFIAGLYHIKTRSLRGRIIGKKFLLFVFLIGVVPIGYISLSQKHDLKVQRFHELLNPFTARSVQARIRTHWSDSLDLIIKNPIGYGTGSATTTTFSRGNYTAGQLIGPHNEILFHLVERGVVGLSTFVLLFVFMVRISYRHRMDSSLCFVSAALFSILVSYLAQGMFNLPISMGGTSAIFWILVGILLGKLEFPHRFKDPLYENRTAFP